MSKNQSSLSYDRIYAIASDMGVIVKLSGHGYAALSGKEKQDGAYINVADFAASHLKFDPYGAYKKVSNDAEISAEVIENVKYTLAHAAGTYGVLHPGLKIEGIE